jgi:hypothetical protein
MHCVGNGAELHAFPTSAFHATSSSFRHFILLLYRRLGGPSAGAAVQQKPVVSTRIETHIIQPTDNAVSLLTALSQQFD